MGIRNVLLAATAALPVTGAAGEVAAQSTVSAGAPASNTAGAPAAADANSRGPVRREGPVVRRLMPGAASEANKSEADKSKAGKSVTAPVAAAPSAIWSADEIAAAKAHCSAVLQGVDAQTEVEEPIRDGRCGAPVVVKLVSVGKSPAVLLSPPATVTCDMVAALGAWMKAEVQPLARRELGGSVVKLENMSSYSCRNAYGRARTNLSEHGRANALDIGGFVTAAGDTTRVLTSWGTIQREVRAVAAKAEAQKAATAAAAGAGKGGAGAPSRGDPYAVVAPATMPTLPGVIVRGMSGHDLGGPSLGFTTGSNRLGGPKPKDAAAVVVPGPADAKPSNTGRLDGKAAVAVLPELDPQRMRFLHQAHASACKYFGTVLGPEANNDHKNHFHLDMAPRKTGNFCE